MSPLLKQLVIFTNHNLVKVLLHDLIIWQMIQCQIQSWENKLELDDAEEAIKNVAEYFNKVVQVIRENRYQ